VLPTVAAMFGAMGMVVEGWSWRMVRFKSPRGAPQFVNRRASRQDCDDFLVGRKSGRGRA
jgi:hypothetical protein